MAAKKFILNFTPTGIIPTKEISPKVPITPEEIIEQVLEAADLGANMVHCGRQPDRYMNRTHWPLDCGAPLSQ